MDLQGDVVKPEGETLISCDIMDLDHLRSQTAGQYGRNDKRCKIKKQCVLELPIDTRNGDTN